MRRHNLVSCIDTRIQHFDDLLDLAGKFPNIVICVDHCAIPEARDDAYFKRWRAAVKKLAKAENVAMKISGLGMMDRLWTVDSLRPWVLGCIEAFGVDRVVFGTNWPVDRMFSSYPDIVNAYAKIIAAFSRETMIAWAGLRTRAGAGGRHEVQLLGGVHPRQRGRGLGTRLLAWAEEAARTLHRDRHRGGQLALSASCPADQDDAVALFARAGYQQARWFIS